MSYVQEDGDVVRSLADGLEQAGYGVWYYERDSLPGHSYLEQILEVIEQADAVIVVLSPATLGSPQVNVEISEAHVAGKRFIPLLHDLTYSTLLSRQRAWTMMFGTAVAAPIPVEGTEAFLPRLLRGLRAIGVEPRQDAVRDHPSPRIPPAEPGSAIALPGPADSEQVASGEKPVVPSKSSTRANGAEAPVSPGRKVSPLLEALCQHWWTFILRGVAAIVLVAVRWWFVRYSIGFEIVTATLGTYLIIGGVCAVLPVIKLEPRDRWPFMTEGALGIVAGLLTLFAAFPISTIVNTPASLALFIWALATGWLQIVQARRLKPVTSNAWLLGAIGVASIVLGVFLSALWLFSRTDNVTVVQTLLNLPGVGGSLTLPGLGRGPLDLVSRYALLSGLVFTALGTRLRGLGQS